MIFVMIFIGFFIGNILYCPLGDKFGRKNVIFISSFFSSFWKIIIWFNQNFYIFIIALLFDVSFISTYIGNVISYII